MKNLIKIVTLILLTLLLYWKIILTTDEIIEYLPLKSPKSYKVLRDTTSGNGEWRTVKIVVDKEYYNKTKKMIMGHEKFRNLGYNQDSQQSYKKIILKMDGDRVFTHLKEVIFMKNLVEAIQG